MKLAFFHIAVFFMLRTVVGQLAPTKITPPPALILTLTLAQTLTLSLGGGGAIFPGGKCLDTILLITLHTFLILEC